jgi:hypothetical protein
MMLSMVSCAKNPRCTLDAAKEKMNAEESVIAYVYDDEKSYEVKSDVLEKMLSGEWKEASRDGDAKKVLSVTVGVQYEVCFFEDGSAMIYSGLAGILQRDRAYYEVKLDVSLEEMCNMIRESGEEVAESEDNNAPSAE